ncbi:phenylacetate--CoA ligase family protein [Nocardia elegans]|uniref:Phenylacetate--CoA ligase family protein n=1 Tax=Nocardia elegans TaxID=300029 RepID=A0ABW6TNB2_9NOCA|nr:phenylacetate--CoA ligase family protein [Nocardia elegans]
MKRHDVDPAAIGSPDEFRFVPAVTKENYLQQYPPNMLLWHGDPAEAGTWSSSSGSTGRPTYWPRDILAQDDATELYARIFRQCFHAHRRSTLVIVGFAMGNWIGGTYTYSAMLALRRRGYKLSVIAPGIEVDTILDNIATLGPLYDQVVVAGYPPFVKDLLDRANNEVLRQDLRLLLAGEAITEAWRDYVLDRIGEPRDSVSSCLVYGTADAGIMGHETRTTIAIRRAARSDDRLAEALLGPSEALPTFVEYDADYRFVEVDDQGRFLFTVDNSLPLVRYRINDVGHLITPTELSETLLRTGHRLPVFTSTETCSFLALDRRTDVAASFYGLKIYPDSVHAALDDPVIAGWVTGKFILSPASGADLQQTLHLRVELQPTKTPNADVEHRLRHAVVNALLRTNSEFARLHQTLGHAAEPEISLRAFGSPGFEVGVKHQWAESAR